VINKGLSRRLEASGKAVRKRLQLGSSLFPGRWSLKSLKPLTHGDLNGSFRALTCTPCEFFNQSKGFRALDLQGHDVSLCNAPNWESTNALPERTVYCPIRNLMNCLAARVDA
jgi:hypothetical protein